MCEILKDGNVNYYVGQQEFFDTYGHRPDFFLLLLKYRRFHNKNSIVINYGEPRSGKSFADMFFCEELESGWDAESNVFMDIKSFLRANRNAKGRCFILEETSVQISNREWFSDANRVISNFLTTQGFRGNILFLNLPVISHIDKRSLALCHYVIKSLAPGVVRIGRIKNMDNINTTKLIPRWFSWIDHLPKPSEKTQQSYKIMKETWNEKNLIDDLASLDGFKPRNLNDVKVLDLFKKGIINEEKAIEKLKKIRFSDEDIKLLLTRPKEDLDYIPTPITAERLAEIQELSKPTWEIPPKPSIERLEEIKKLIS